MFVDELATVCAEVGPKHMRLEERARDLSGEVDLGQEGWVSHRH